MNERMEHRARAHDQPHMRHPAAARDGNEIAKFSFLGSHFLPMQAMQQNRLALDAPQADVPVRQRNPPLLFIDEAHKLPAI